MSNQTTNNITYNIYEYNNPDKTIFNKVLEELTITFILEHYLSLKEYNTILNIQPYKNNVTKHNDPSK